MVLRGGAAVRYQDDKSKQDNNDGPKFHWLIGLSVKVEKRLLTFAFALDNASSQHFIDSRGSVCTGIPAIPAQTNFFGGFKRNCLILYAMPTESNNADFHVRVESI